MSVIDSIHKASNKAIDQSEAYLAKSHDYYKLKIFQQLSISITMIFKTVVIGGIILISLVFLATALAFYLGALVKNYTIGFLMVGFLFSVFAGLLYVFRGSIDSKIIQKLSKTFFNNE